MTTHTAAGPEAALDAALGWSSTTARLAAALDDAELFPAQACARLDAFGLPAYYVPTEWGGVVEDHETMLRLWRTVARRDLSALIAHAKTYLGATPIWLAGNAQQCSDSAAAIIAGAPIAWGLSEPEHGADLVHGSLTATPRPGGYRLDGRKWPVNNATRADRMTVLARTGDLGKARGFSLFLVDRRELPANSWRSLPKAATLGIRGIDISGIAFDGAHVPDSALIGAEGTGLETVLKALQLTRTMCAALSLGAGEQALRIVAGFTAERVIQRRALLERAHPSSIVARCAALLAAVEAAALVGARSIHSLTGEMSVTSAVVKSVAPTLVDSTLAELAELLGVRSFLTDTADHGAFQRLFRDHQVVSVFDGSTPVNRGALAQQFPALVSSMAGGEYDAAGLAEAVAVGHRPRPLDRSALAFRSRTGCSVVQSLPVLADSPAVRNAPPAVAERASALLQAIGQLCDRMAQVRPAARPAMEAYELAEAYELCYAGAACLHLWAAVAPEHADAPLWQDALWVRAALRALLDRLAAVLRTAPAAPATDDASIDATLSRRIAEAAASGAPVTPFGTGQVTG